jgi:broad specificity phosphatase PhoE
VETKTVIFVRHGESTWNDTFNKGDRPKISFVLHFIPNLIYAACVEWYFFVSGKENDSWFYDAPLSEKGLGQAVGVHSFLQSSIEYKTPREAELIKLMLGTSPGSSQLVSSNLRRAISTMAVGFQERLSRTGDQILILPQLQEISRNPDALSITPPHGSVVPSWTDPDYLKPILTKHVDTSMHTGNKPVNSNGLLRMQAFCQVVFDDIDKDCVVAAGHSLWFRSFFRTYLPMEMEHPAKKKKLVNGGCVGFVLKRSGKEYMIDPSSITVLHGGF